MKPAETPSWQRLSNYNLLDRWLFGQAMVRDKHLDRGALRAAFLLLDYYNAESNAAWPSYDTLAEDLGVNRRNIIKAVKRLVEAGWFEVTVKGGRTRSNRYRPCWRKADETVMSNDVNSDVFDHKQCLQHHPNLPRTSLTKRGEEVGAPQVGEPKGSPMSEEVLETAFEEFWQQCPKQEGRLKALNEYKRVMRGGVVSHQELISAIMRYSASVAEADPRFIKYPSNWLLEECWRDSPNESRVGKPWSRKKTVSAGNGRDVETASQLKEIMRLS